MLNILGTFAGLLISFCGCQTEATIATIHCQVLPQPMTYSDAAAAVAAERLTALAQSSKAIENARQVPQDRRTSLAGLACRPADESGGGAGGGGGGAPASALKKRFPSAVSSGSLAAAGGSTAAADGSNDSGGSGSAGGGSDGAGGDRPAADTPFTEADLPNLKEFGLQHSSLTNHLCWQRRHCACWARTLLRVPTCLSYETERPLSAIADSESSTFDTLKPQSKP